MIDEYELEEIPLTEPEQDIIKKLVEVEEIFESSNLSKEAFLDLDELLTESYMAAKDRLLGIWKEKYD